MDPYVLDDFKHQHDWAKRQIRELRAWHHPYDPDRTDSFDDLSPAEIDEYEQWLRSFL